METRAAREYVPPFDRALLMAALGRDDEALIQLERAYEERNALLWFRIHLPYFDHVAGSARYRAIAERLARLAPVSAVVRGKGSGAVPPA
jgi:hypothetical protein